MTPKRQVQKMLDKLSKPHWMPVPINRYLTNPEGKDGIFNLYWALQGRPAGQAPGDLAKGANHWKLASHIAAIRTPGGTIGESVVVLSSKEFWSEYVKPNHLLFTKCVPLSEWQRTLDTDKFDLEPVCMKSYLKSLKKA